MKKLILAACIGQVVACAPAQVTEYSYEPDPQLSATTTAIQLNDSKVEESITGNGNATVAPATRMVYKRAIAPRAELAMPPVTIGGDDISLLKALTEPFENVSVATNDSFVNLEGSLRIWANKMRFKDYVNHLESITGYTIDFENGVFKVTGNKVVMLDVSGLKNDKGDLDQLIENSKPFLGTNDKGSYIGLINANNNLVISGPPGLVDRASKMIQKAIDTAEHLVNVDLKVYSKVGGGSQELFYSNKVVRNGKSAKFDFGKTFFLPATITSDEGTLEDVTVGMQLMVAPSMTTKNRLLVKVLPKISSVQNSKGNAVLRPSDIQSIVNASKMIETEIVMNSGQTIDIGTGIGAMIQDGIRINSDKRHEAKTLLLSRSGDGQSLSEFKITLGATVVETK